MSEDENTYSLSHNEGGYSNEKQGKNWREFQRNPVPRKKSKTTKAAHNYHTLDDHAWKK